MARPTATAWILDVAHRTRRLECDVPPGARPLAAAQAAARRELGLELRNPIGFAPDGGGAELLFVVPRTADSEGWTPLARWAPEDDRGFALYVQAMLGGWEPPTRALDVFFFGDGPELAAKLAHQVVKGRKRGTTGWVAATEREGATFPTPGLVSIVTDGFGYAQCAILTERVERLRFADIGPEHALVEGEGDRTLEDWRDGHLRYFHDEARRIRLVFSEEEEVFFERFRVLAVFGRANPVESP